MGFLDKFKSKKEQEVKESSDSTSEAAKKTTKDTTNDREGKKKLEVKIDELPEELGDVIIHPYITEKTAILADGGKYSFVVNMDANKVEIKEAIKKMYGVSPESINTQIVRGKTVRFGRTFGKRSNWKKAVVTLKEGESIEIFEGV